MKVLHLIDSGGLYGAEKMLLALVAEQIRQGHDPMILSAGEPGIGNKAIEVEADRQNLPVFSWRMKPGLNIREAIKVSDWAFSNGYQILHSHGYKFNILMGILPKKIRKLPLVCTLHGYVKSPFPTKMWIYEAIDKCLLRRADQVILVRSDMEADLGVNAAKHLKWTVISNGIALPSIQGTGRGRLDDQIDAFATRHRPLIGAIGRLSREKNLDLLVGSFIEVRKVFPHAGLILAGEGPQKKALEKIIDETGLTESVLLPGYCNSVPELLERLNILVMPSITEGMPITLLEAMAAKTPILASRVGGIPEVLEHGRCGYLFELNNADQLAVSIINCLEDENQTQLRVKNAKERVNIGYSSQSMATEYSKVYKKLCG